MIWTLRGFGIANAALSQLYLRFGSSRKSKSSATLGLLSKIFRWKLECHSPSETHCRLKLSSSLILFVFVFLLYFLFFASI